MWNLIKELIAEKRRTAESATEKGAGGHGEEGFLDTGTPESEEARRLVATFMAYHEGKGFAGMMVARSNHSEAYEPILTAPPRVQALVAAAVCIQCARGRHDERSLQAIAVWHAQGALLQTLLRRDIPFTAMEIDRMLGTVAGAMTAAWVTPYYPIKLVPAIVAFCEALKERGELTSDHRAHLRTMMAKIDGAKTSSAQGRKTVARLADTLADEAGPDSGLPLDPSDAWATLAEEELAAMTEAERRPWRRLFTHARTASAGKPAIQWLDAARPLLEEVGGEKFTAALSRWSREVQPRPCESRVLNPSALPPLHEGNSDVLKGLVWSCAALGDTASAGIVADLAAICYRKVPGVGPICMKVGNACLITLEKMGDMNAVAQLSRLRNKIRYAVAQRLVQRALETAAANAGMTVADLEEIALPTYGLRAEEGMNAALASCTAEIRISPAAELKITWRNAGGKAQQTVPAEVKTEAAEEWKELKRTLGELGKLLEAQRARVERLFRVERHWRYEDWRARYLDHPLTAPYARRLIWQFAPTATEAVLGIWRDGRLVDVNDQPLPAWPAETIVTLWHPIASEPGEVATWREWLLTRQVVQPFKQAHREIYVLTDAERETSSYSNRFAAHILRQHQLAALASQRGWTYRLQGTFDSANNLEVALPEWNLRASFWIEGREGIGETAASGIFVHVAADQVRFLRDEEPVPLAEVPPLIFSEIMRDVDLFVGVTSVANDPTWQDRGENPGYAANWERFAFGELSPTAETRRELLMRLVPKLKIAARCSFEGRFLVVCGELSTYKIHLGSANILMAPNDRYLCIVPGRRREDEKVFLPFEGDSTLSLILSKAFLLAADTKITDPSIQTQIYWKTPGVRPG